MRILLISTLKRNVSSQQFASRSRIIYEVGKGLVERGHEVLLLGTGDSGIPGVKVIPLFAKGWVDLPPVENNFFRECASLLQLTKKIEEIQDSFDVIHNHTYPDFFPIVAGSAIHTPLLTTLHAVAADYIDDTLSLFPGFYYAALSEAYRKLYKKSKIQYVVHNGIDAKLYAFSDKKEDYFLWLGRLPKGRNPDGSFIDPKGVRAAIALAEQTNSLLLLGGTVEDEAFFLQDVKPHLSDKILWVGDVSPQQSIPIERVVSLMQGAKGFLMTVQQEEPFGLVMAEAMSCGTPVVAYAKGAASEIVVDGVTGFVVNSSDTDVRGDWIVKKTGIEGLREAIERINALSPEEYFTMRKSARKRVVDHFTIEKMVDGYEKVYEEIINKSTKH